MINQVGAAYLEKLLFLAMKKDKSVQEFAKNSLFNTCWITNGIISKKIKKIDLILYENTE